MKNKNLKKKSDPDDVLLDALTRGVDAADDDAGDDDKNKGRE